MAKNGVSNSNIRVKCKVRKLDRNVCSFQEKITNDSAPRLGLKSPPEGDYFKIVSIPDRTEYTVVPHKWHKKLATGKEFLFWPGASIKYNSELQRTANGEPSQKGWIQFECKLKTRAGYFLDFDAADTVCETMCDAAKTETSDPDNVVTPSPMDAIRRRRRNQPSLLTPAAKKMDGFNEQAVSIIISRPIFF